MTTLPVHRRTIWHAFVLDPLHLATSQPHQILISAIPVTLSAFFFGSSTLIPYPIALAAAIGVEYAYLKGIGEAAQTGSVWGRRLVYGTFAFTIFTGFFSLAGSSYHIEAILHPAPFLAGLMALTEILILAWIGMCSSILHTETDRHVIEVAAEREATRQRTIAEVEAQERQRQSQREQMRLEDEAARLAMLRDQEQERHKLALWNEAQHTKVALRMSTQSVNDASTLTAAQPRQPASGRDKTTSVNALVLLIRDNPSLTKTVMAQRLGVSRGTLYNIHKDAVTAGVMNEKWEVVDGR